MCVYRPEIREASLFLAALVGGRIWERERDRERERVEGGKGGGIGSTCKRDLSKKRGGREARKNLDSGCCCAVWKDFL